MAKLKIDVAPSLQRLDLIVKGLVNTRFIGNYASAFKGQGLEFADYRTYTQNDDASKIDWKASHKSGKLLIKEFVEERNINVFFSVDVSSKMLLGTTSKLKAEYVAELVSSLSHTILRTGDHVGLSMFSEKQKDFLRPNNGMKQYSIISKKLSEVANYGGACSIKKDLEHSIKTLERGTILILISDFITDENFSETLKLASKKFDLIGICIRDPIDLKLPVGQGEVQLQDPSTGEKMLITPKKYSRLYEQETKKQISNLEHEFREAGADFLLLTTDQSFIKKLVAFFKMRQSKWK